MLTALTNSPMPAPRRVIVSRLGGPDYKPAEYHFAGHVVDMTPSAVRVLFDNGVGEHVFSLDSGAWLEGSTMRLRDCVLSEQDFVDLRAQFPQAPTMGPTMGLGSATAALQLDREVEAKKRAEASMLAQAGNQLRDRV